MRLADVYLDVNLSVSLGLILNELVTNSIKHAFPEKKSGLLEICLTENDNLLELTVSDNGVGLPVDFNIKKANSLGLELVDTLINQHHGELEINRNGKTEFKIHLHK
jgi:two-component sensor histidine kinase